MEPADFSDEEMAGLEDKVGVDVPLAADDGVVKHILRKGEGWATPERGDEVSVHYVGTLLDGTKFDSSRDRGAPFVFILGEGRVIKGWDTGVAAMKQGELARLTCKPDFAYGAAGSPPTIPPDATLVFEVELLSWRSVKDITGDGGVIKTVLAEGSGWQNPKDADEVVVAYSARLAPAAAPGGPGGKRVSAAEAGAPVVAASPEGGAVFGVAAPPCPGFGAALRSMKLAESAVLRLSAEYAKGVAEVPEGQVLEVELKLEALHQVSSPAPGVSKKTLAEPEGSYMKPNDGSTVTALVTSRAADGSLLEAERELTFTTDEEQVPEGLELAIASMREGEVAVVSVSSAELIAAPEGALLGADVPAGTASVTYEVTLKSFTKAKEKWEMNNAEKLAAALARKEKGNAAFKAGRLARAARQYAAAVEAATSVSERDLAPAPATDDPASPSGAALLGQAKEVKKASMLNLAATELKREAWGEAAKQAGKVLELDPANVKALYRRAAARLGLGELLEAEFDVRAGLLAEPDNRELQALAKRLKVALRELNKREGALYSRMFAGLSAGRSAQPAPPAAAAEQQAGVEPMQEDPPAPAGAAPAAPIVQAAA